MQRLLRLLSFSVFLCLVFNSVSPLDVICEENNPQLSNLMLDTAFRKGVDLFLSKEYDQAEYVFRHCIEREPSNAEYTCWLAQTLGLILGERAMKGASPLSLLSDGRKVRNLYTKAMELNPRNERARIGHAVILRDIPGWLGGSVKKAEKILQEVIEDNPKNLSAQHFLGTLYIRKTKKYEKGIEILKESINSAENMELTPEEQYNLFRTNHAVGKSYLENLDQPEKAIPFFEKSLEIEPDSPVTLLDIAEAYRLTGHENEAKETLRKAASIIQGHQYKRFKKELVREAKKLKMRKELDL